MHIQSNPYQTQTVIRWSSLLLLHLLPLVLPGLSNIIGIIVYISSNAGDPSDKKDEDRKNQYNYGWSFYFGALSFIVAESMGVLAVNIYIEKNKEMRFQRDFVKGTSSSSPYSRIPSYRYRRRRSRSSSRSTDPSREASPVGMKIGRGSSGGGLGMGLPMRDISLYALSRDPLKGGSGTLGPYSSERDSGFLQVHNCFQKDLKDGGNRRTTPVWDQEFTETRSLMGWPRRCTVEEKTQSHSKPNILSSHSSAPQKVPQHVPFERYEKWIQNITHMIQYLL